MDQQQFIARTQAVQGRLYRVSRTLLRCDADCEDAVQEAIVKAWVKLDTLREEQYFETWLIRILINECKNVYRRKIPGEALPETLTAPEPPDPALRDALERLDVKFRLPLVLHYLEGYRVREIAKMLRLPEGTVKRRLHQARKLLKSALKGGA